MPQTASRFSWGHAPHGRRADGVPLNLYLMRLTSPGGRWIVQLWAGHERFHAMAWDSVGAEPSLDNALPTCIETVEEAVDHIRWTSLDGSLWGNGKRIPLTEPEVM